MKQSRFIIVFLVINLFILILIQGCIPLNNVHNIDTYEIKKGKPKSKNTYKKYTKYMYTNNSPHQIVIKFLEDKFGTTSADGWFFSTSEKLFLDENIEFTITFILETKQQRYLNLFNLFYSSKNDDYYYDSELDDPVQDGEKYRYVSVTISGDGGVDYLAENSVLRDRLIVYLKNLKREYEVYRHNYNFINGK